MGSTADVHGRNIISFLHKYFFFDNVLHFSGCMGRFKKHKDWMTKNFLKEQRIRVDIYSYKGTWGLQNHYKLHLLKGIDGRNFK